MNTEVSSAPGRPSGITFGSIHDRRRVPGHGPARDGALTDAGAPRSRAGPDADEPHSRVEPASQVLTPKGCARRDHLLMIMTVSWPCRTEEPSPLTVASLLKPPLLAATSMVCCPAVSVLLTAKLQ